MVPLKNKKAQEYALHIQEIVKQLKRTSKKGIEENKKFIVPTDEAREKYNGRLGEVFYRFPNDAPSQEIIDAYEKVKPYSPYDEHPITFEQHLSHRQMTVLFFDGDLIIKKDREMYFDPFTENNLIGRIQYAKENYQIDWDNAKIFIFPYKGAIFFISDSFEGQMSGRADHQNPNNWLVVPFKDNVDFYDLKKQCKAFEKEHPIEDDSPLSITLTMDDVWKDIYAEKNGKSMKAD